MTSGAKTGIYLSRPVDGVPVPPVIHFGFRMGVVGTMRTQHKPVEGVEASSERSEVRVAEAEVPLAQHVGLVAQLLELLGQETERLVHPELLA